MDAAFGPPPDDPEPLAARLRSLVEWWNGLRVYDEPGVTTWEVLDPIERQVTECVAAKPPKLLQAESLTAKAMLLVAGCATD